MKIKTTTRSTIAQALIASMASGTANANPVLEIYDGTMPDNVGDTVTSTLLATLALTPTVATEANGVITFDAITEDSAADATATAAWARILDRDEVESVYLTVSAIDAGGEVQLNSVDLVAGVSVSISSGVITVGGG